MKVLLQASIIGFSIISMSWASLAVETTSTTETSVEANGNSAKLYTDADLRNDWHTESFYSFVKTKYNFSDAQITELKAATLNQNQTLRVAELSRMSGKSITEILRMRFDEKKGWGLIAKELNLRESQVSHAVNKARSERRELMSKADARIDKQRSHLEDKADRKEDQAFRLKDRVEARKPTTEKIPPGLLKKDKR